jgi:flagellar hook-associated protein 1 FlgK
MNANQLALSVASNNIANANNPNFSRQRLMTQPARSDGGAWSVGSGVEVLGVEALRDALVEAGLKRELSAQSGASTLASRLSHVEVLFNDSNGTGLLQSITDFFNSFQTLSTDPASLPLRTQVQAKANAFIQALHRSDQNLSDIKTLTDKAITSDLSNVNRLIDQIADLTRQIKIEEVVAPAHDLRDQRSALVKELSSHIEVHELESGDYQLTTNTNRLLVLNNFAQPLTAAEVTAGMGGSLGAELDIRDTYIPKYADAVDQMAYEVAQQVNAIHSAAYDLNGNTNIDFFSPLASASGAARLIGLSTDVATDPTKIAASNQPTGNDNGAAIAMGNLLHAPVFTGGSITDQYGALVFAIGSDTANAQTSTEQHDALVTQLQNRRQSISGVSMEEETTQIMQFQRAYQASARLVQTIDQLLEVTLQMGR